MREKIDPFNNKTAILPGSFTGMILAGGRSKRFGFNKLEIKIGSIPLFIDQVFKLNQFCSEILIVTSQKNRSRIVSELDNIAFYKTFYNSHWAFDTNKIKVLNDEGVSEAAGSIIGLYTGLKKALNYFSLVFASDMPFISKRLITLLLYGTEEEGYIAETFKPENTRISISSGARIIKTEKGFEVLCGLYSKSCLEAIGRNIKEKNFRISDIFTYVDTEIIDSKKLNAKKIDDLNFFNINSLEDYYRFNNIWNSSTPVPAGPNNAAQYYMKKWENFYLR